MYSTMRYSSLASFLFPPAAVLCPRQGLSWFLEVLEEPTRHRACSSSLGGTISFTPSLWECGLSGMGGAEAGAPAWLQVLEEPPRWAGSPSQLATPACVPVAPSRSSWLVSCPDAFTPRSAQVCRPLSGWLCFHTMNRIKNCKQKQKTKQNQPL